MMISSNRIPVLGWLLVLGLLLSLTVIGCATNQEKPKAMDESDITLPDGSAEYAQLSEDAMRGAQLWADNCIRCHNTRPPRALSDEQWSIVMMHMRVRAGLTGKEQRQILKFLQAAN